MEGVDLGPTDRLILDNYLAMIHGISQRISRVDEQITAIACRDENVKLLMSMTGIDVYTALLIRSEICDITRFANYKKLVAWAGLAPSQRSSGDTKRTGHITKQGSKWLRNAMVEAANTTIQHDQRIKSFYTRIAARRGPQKARVAAAKEMLVISWHMLTKMEPYRTQNHSLTERKYKKLEKDSKLD